MLADRFVEHLFGELDRFGGAAGTFGGDFVCPRPEMIGLEHFMEEADAMRNRLANCLLSLSTDASTDINALAAEALRALDAM